MLLAELPENRDTFWRAEMQKKKPSPEAFIQKALDAVQEALNIPKKDAPVDSVNDLYHADLRAHVSAFAALHYLAADQELTPNGPVNLTQAARNFSKQIADYQKTMRLNPQIAQTSSSEIVTTLETKMKQWLGQTKTNGHDRA